MSQHTRRTVLVTGATGQQGGATARALLKAGKVQVRALTRDPSRPSARKLADAGAELAAGDFDDAESLRKALEGVSGVFSVQSFMDDGVEAEARRGIALADAAKKAGVQHLVYTSVDGAERKSGVPHFDSKYRIEQHIQGLGIPATILRPVAFMDLFRQPGAGRSIFLGVLRAALGDAKPLQVVATEDIGWFAARALESPEEYAGRALALAGDSLTVPQMTEVMQRVEGRPVRKVPVPGFALRLFGKEMSSMLRWFADHGYQADIAALRKIHPELLSLETWLRKVQASSSAAGARTAHAA